MSMALSENRLPQSVSSGEKSIISAKIIQNSHFYGVKNPPDSGAHPKQTFFSQWKPVWKTGPLMFSPLEQWFWTTTASWLSFRLLFFLVLSNIHLGLSLAEVAWPAGPVRHGWPFYWWPPLERSSSRAFWLPPCRPSAITWGSRGFSSEIGDAGHWKLGKGVVPSGYFT